MTFNVDHHKLNYGIYKDEITYDLRLCIPYKDPLMSNVCLHSIEHILAVKLNQKINKIYFGPMGCQTGFYLLSDNKEEEVYKAIVESCTEAIEEKIVPFNTEAECGHCYTLAWTEEVERKLTLLKELGEKAIQNPGCFVYPIL